MHDWQWELKHSLKSPEELAAFFEITFPQLPYSTFITPWLATRIKEYGTNSPLGLQFLPRLDEMITLEDELDDPIGDHLYSPIPGMVHRYPNRVLIFPTTVCPVHCRYCFRKNELNSPDELFSFNLEKIGDYLSDHFEVNEVILSGGDPLILSNSKLEKLLNTLTTIKHIKTVRFHTRAPSVLPQRFDGELAELLDFHGKKVHLLMVMHINHQSEWSPEWEEKWNLFKHNSMGWLSQSVLLKGVNDNVSALKELFEGLSFQGIRPYYLHHPDAAKGTAPYRLSLEEGRIIYHQLRAQLSGWMLPHYVVERAQGGGKSLAYNPEVIEFSGSFLPRDSAKH